MINGRHVGGIELQHGQCVEQSAHVSDVGGCVEC